MVERLFGLSPVESELIASNAMFGLRVVVNEFAVRDVRRQVRFPRSKRRRIRAKWAKQEKNFAVRLEPTAYRMGNTTIIVHPTILDQLKKAIQIRKERR